MTKAHIFNIQRYCLHDGPGIRTTVFFKGCPLRCLWCHNPESQNKNKQLMYYESKCTGCEKCLGYCDARKRDENRPQNITVDLKKCTLCGKCIEECGQKANEFCGTEKNTDDIFAEVLKDKIFYGTNGGMTLSGGEPAAQPQPALELLQLAKENGINSIVETSGFGTKTFFEEANNLGAVFYFDIKTLDREKHTKLTGVSLSPILKNLKFLMQKDAKIVLRLPLIPNVNDTDKELLLLSRFLKENEEKYHHAEIMKYHNLGKSKAKALSREYKAPNDSTSEKEAERWINTLKNNGTEKIFFSDK